MSCPPHPVPFFARKTLAHEGVLRVRVEGKSMVPCVAPGDQILLGPGSPSVGEIVTFSCGPRLITHRCVGRQESGGQRYLITKGDASLLFDLPVPEEAVVGKALALTRGKRWISLTGRFWRRVGWAIALFSWGIGTLYALYTRMIKKEPHAPV